MTHRRKSCCRRLILAAMGMLALLAGGRAHADLCSTLPANPSQSAVQGALNACHDGGYVQGVAGLTSVSSTINIPCGVMLVGPTANPATMQFSTGTALLFLFGQSGSCSSSNSSGISYLKTINGLAFYTDGSNHANILITHNQFTAMQTNDSSNAEQGAINFQMGNGNTVNGATIEYNTIGDSSSCTQIENDQSSGGKDGCGIEIFGQGSSPNIGHMVNLVVKYNEFFHINEAMHFYGSNYVMNAPANTCDNCDIEYNYFHQDHRITIEFQMQMINHPLIISNNVFTDPLHGYFNSYIVSTPCCQFGSTQNSATIAPSYHFENNLEYSNTGQFEWGLEYAGNVSVNSHNLVQGNICVGVQSGYAGTAGGPNSTYNTWQGPIMAGGSCSDYPGNGSFISPEFGGSYHGGTITPNVTGATPAPVVSVAPTISPASGAYTSPPTITLTDPGYTSSTSYVPLGNTSIWYTTDGSTPVPGGGSTTLYTAPFAITLPATIKAVGMWGTPPQPTSYPSGYGFTPSAVQTASYTSAGGVTLSSVALTDSGAVHTLTAGAALQMSAVCTYSDGSTTNCSTTDSFGNGVSSWQSSNAAVSLSSAGLATGVAAGSANLTAVIAGMTTPNWAMAVTAPAVSLSSIALTTAGGITTLAAGSVNQLTATCTYSDFSTTNCTNADAHGNDSTFTSTAPSVATVNASGVLTGVAAGGTTLQAAVSPGMVASNWGTPTSDVVGFTTAGFINSQYFVFGSQAGGYGGAGATCSFFLPAGTLVNGSKYDCGLIPAPTPTTQATAWLCYGTYTVSGTTAPNAFVTVTMTGCPATIADGTAEWVAVSTNATGHPNAGFSDCGGAGCSGAAPATGAGTYPYHYIAVPYGTRSGMGTAMIAAGASQQASQYVTFGQPAIVSNTVPLTVTAAAPTLVSATVTASASTMTTGTTLQFAAHCGYSDGSTTDCTVADLHGNAVTMWTSDSPSVVTMGAVGSAHPGLATAVAAGAANLSASVGSLTTPGFAMTVTNPAVTLSSLSLGTTGGVTGIFVGQTNQLVATCTYSDGSTTDCTTLDSHGNVAGSYQSSAPSHAAVNTVTGLVSAIALGATTLTAAVNGLPSPAIPFTVLAVPSGVYQITIKGPVRFSGTVRF